MVRAFGMAVIARCPPMSGIIRPVPDAPQKTQPVEASKATAHFKRRMLFIRQLFHILKIRAMGCCPAISPTRQHNLYPILARLTFVFVCLMR